MSDEQKAAAEFYAKASPREARKHALRGYAVTGQVMLEPCPFCGPGNSLASAYFDDVAQRHRVGCGRCGCSTGTHKAEAEAIAAWNTRAALAQRAGEGDDDSEVTGCERGADGRLKAVTIWDHPTGEQLVRFERYAAPNPAPAADAVERHRLEDIASNIARQIKEIALRTMHEEKEDGVRAGSRFSYVEEVANHAIKTALLSALPSGWRPIDSAPDGWVMVPKEPTQEMLAAGQTMLPDDMPTADAVYKMMLAASPKEPNR